MNAHRFLIVIILMILPVRAAEFTESARRQLESTSIKTNTPEDIALILQQEFENVYGVTIEPLSAEDAFIKEFGSKSTTVISVLRSLNFGAMVKVIEQTGINTPLEDAAKLQRIFYKAIIPLSVFEKLAAHNMVPGSTELSGVSRN